MHELFGPGWRLLIGDVRQNLRALPEKSLHCCPTSPPYWGLRKYQTSPQTWGDGWRGHFGNEPTPEMYVAHSVEIFREVKRVLRDDGVFWLNLGDSYNANFRGGGESNATEKQKSNRGTVGFMGTSRTDVAGLKPKDLVGIPWMVAFALRADGWYLRDAIVWRKPSPMPGSQQDRCTSSYEMIFQFTKSEKYFFDIHGIDEPTSDPHGSGNGYKRSERISVDGRCSDRPHDPAQTRTKRNVWSIAADGSEQQKLRRLAFRRANRLKYRSNIWTFANTGFRGAHFATFPAELPLTCIQASTSDRGCCPACGAQHARLTIKVRRPTRPGNVSKIPGQDDEIYQDHDSVGSEPGKVSPALAVGNRDPLRHVTVVKTIGWNPTCDCVGADGLSLPPIPATVLDPFSGSGTTLGAAVKLGRRGIGIELSPEYAAFTGDRIASIVNAKPKKPSKKRKATA